MPATSSGRIVKSRKGKTGTPHQKNHRWESFTVKISKLHSLDPLRRVRRHDLDAEDFESTTSYFRNGLDKWADMDVSREFISFKREVNPLCESLPQIIHFEGKIMDLLEKYISAQSRESLESLLDLLTAFAHDLGTRFEKHYPRALALITQIVSRKHEADVIEWTFACLAFLFKYLSRLLVTDIRPTYDAVAPLLGKARNPQYIARFAAEAMSFLIKKAAAPSYREKSLPLIVEHARNDLKNTRGDKQYELYYHGLMTMFAEAMKGQGNGVHTTAPALVKALIGSVPEEESCSEEPETWADVVCGTVISIIHHTTSETFEPIAQAIYDSHDGAQGLHNVLFLRLLGIIAGVRKGTRITDWSTLLDFQRQCLAGLLVDKSALTVLEPSAIWDYIIVNIAIVWQYASFDAVTPHIADLMKTLATEPLKGWFIPFCSYFSELDANKFRSLFQNHFQKFIGSHWAEDSNQDMLYILLPRMVQSQALPSLDDSKPFSLPQAWQEEIIKTFGRLEDTPFPEAGPQGCDESPAIRRNTCLPKYAAILHLLEYASVDTKTTEFISDRLSTKLKLALRPSDFLGNEEARFIVSQGFASYIRLSKAVGKFDESLGPLLRAAAPRYSTLTGYLEAMLTYEAQAGSSPQGDDSESPEKEQSPLLKSLIGNLASQSSELRTASLKLLSSMKSAPDQLDALSIMLHTQQMPLDLQNARAISVYLRKLGAIYARLHEDSWLRQAVPAYLFGMLTVKLLPVWETAVEALKQVSQSSSGEEAVCDRAFTWLESSSKRWDGSGQQATGPPRRFATDFECLNLNQLRKKADDSKRASIEASDVLLHEFEESQELAEENPANARSQALKVFSAAPNLVEKRSRKLVPIFLSWASDTDDQADNFEEEQASSTGEFWSLTDRKALLGVFAQFVNPKVLFQSQQVYDALLKQLANGDIEVQKAALKAILAWKQEGLKPYRESLDFLLDEARFKNELTVLFQGDNQIQPKHHDEAMPVLLRLLYGRTISKKGASSGRGGLHATRLAVLRNLSVEDMGGFLDIALGDLRGVHVVDANGNLRADVLNRNVLTVRKQVGFLNMISSMINELGTSVADYTSTIISAVLYCLVNACRKLDKAKDGADEDDGDTNTSLLRNVRSIALKCVVSLLQNAQMFNWAPYSDVIIKEVVAPRLDNLPTENTEGVSGTMQLLSTLSLIPKTALFLGIDERIIGKLTDLLLIAKAKDEVKIFALSIVRNLIKLAEAPAAESEFNELIKEELLDSNLEMILGKISRLLRSQERTDTEPGKELGKDLLAACVETIVELSPLVQQSGNATDLIDISVFLLNQPPRRVHPKVKGSVLTILENFLQLENVSPDSELRSRIYTTISSLYNFFKDKSSREALSRVLAVFVSKDSNISDEVARLCAKLNSYVEGRIDEPAYDERLDAYNTIPRCRSQHEYGILSTNSADGINRFADAAASSTGKEKDKFFEMLQSMVLPAIFAGARETSETVRRETVRVLGHLVTRLPSWSPISDLVHLNPPPDEKDTDPSFFSHILSSAASRQIRALQLLSKVISHTELSSRNLAHFFVPLLEHFVYGREDGEDDHGVGAQASTTIADISISLEWPQYRATLSRYIGYIQSKPEQQKHVVRLLGKLIDSLALAATEKYEDAMDIDGQDEQSSSKKHRLATTMPAMDKFSDDVINNIMPPLMKYIHGKDETTVSSRVPVGVIIVRLLKVLPAEFLEQKLPGVLTDICHILRSKAWESREMARDTLAKMTALLGPSAFGFVLDELRGALTKGYQLHVLSYTVHAILVRVTPEFQPGDLDYCLDKIVAVIMDDIFGATGQEKDAEEYTSQMKEVKSSKSQDSMELIARTASIGQLRQLVRPLQALLLEKLDLKMVRKIDDLLNRISNGLLGNAAAESRDTLIFCYEVIQKVYESEKPQAEQRLDFKLRRYLVQKGAKKSGERSTTNKYTHKLVRFAFDILRSVLKKHDSLRNAGNISGFVPIFGDAIVGGEEEVKIATFKLLTVLVKVPFKTDDFMKLYKVAAKDAIKSISISTTTTSDLAQTALKLVSVTLRDRRDVPVKDAAVDMLLGKLKDDLTEPLYRHVTFNFLRAVLDRRVETATVYDTLDYVGSIMITNDDKDTRDLARGAFFQFLRDYPQKKNRWAKQLAFVVANLKYEREGGRLSVMEVIHLLLMKSAQDFVQEVATTCFIPLFFVLANDDNEKCRLAAGELLKEIFRKADKDSTSKFLNLLRNWLGQDGNQSVLRLAIQTFGFYFEARESTPKDQKDLDTLLTKINEILDDYATFADDWELINTVVEVVPCLMDKHESVVLANEQLWHAIGKPLASSHPTVKLASIKLLNRYLTDFYENTKNPEETDVLVGSHGLRLEKDAIEALVMLATNLLSPPTIARWRKRIAKQGSLDASEVDVSNETPDVDENLAGEVIQTLARLGKFLDPKPSASDKTDEVGNGNADNKEEDDDEWSGVDDETPKAAPITLHTLLNFLSDILVIETRAQASALVPKVASMQLLELYTKTLPSATHLVPSLNILLTPLHHLTDPSIPIPYSTDPSYTPRVQELQEKARELMETLQKKVGTELYTREVLEVREAVKRRREGRARKRKIEAVAYPDRYGQFKRGKLDKKIKRRKERAGEERQRRHGARY
ncbi:armadillo-type protein [Truncatella angustata]|uniref:Armadillo-type protein n=1 Tax=Truncatella angustata TaxID=152316 RepID=A0A9P9A2F2_9PEZI|nr:armadillo-type protein [Truncatella angustata]KAH6660646.1 armadillo-type protein [Truncatella angustata]